jgi:hypothetical protein
MICRDWPPALKQQPLELADAGFYYIGKFLLSKMFRVSVSISAVEVCFVFQNV